MELRGKRRRKYEEGNNFITRGGDAGTLKMTCTALDLDGNVIRKRVFEGVQVTRNRITTYSGPFFEDGDGEWSQTDFSFVIHADWDGEDVIEF